MTSHPLFPLKPWLAAALLATTAMAAAAHSVAAAAQPAASATQQAGFQAPGFYRLQLGAMEVTALSDGTVPQHMDRLMTAKPGQVRELVAQTFQTLPLETSMNAFLIHTGSQLLLVDTGAGTSFGPAVGNHLLANIAAAGYRADQIDAVLLTHVHGDHSGGLTNAEGQPVFPKALVYLEQREKDYWLSDAELAKAPKNKKPMFAAGRASLAPYLASDRVRTFHGATELFAGIATVPAPGHTPGHTFYKLTSEGQQMVIWGDVVHAAEVQFPEPGITISYDSDEKASAGVRRKAFADASSRGYWVAAPHISFPGIGHVRAQGKGYRWIPATYSLGQ